MNAQDIEAPHSICVGGVLLARAGDILTEAEKRQRVSLELLRQAAMEAGLLSSSDPAPQDGVLSEAAADAIDHYLSARVTGTEPDEAACRRYHAAHAGRYRLGERARVRHILFGVVPGLDIQALRHRAEQTLIDVRSLAQSFDEAARALSNCPSGARGGDLGWLCADDCVPEFAQAVFARDSIQGPVGVLPTLVHSRLGLHVVEVLEREPGTPLPFEAVREAVAQSLRQQSWLTAVHRAVRDLAASTPITGFQLEGSGNTLVQ
jgi:peptidyl-prolyl cis-trans isomerase C